MYKLKIIFLLYLSNILFAHGISDSDKTEIVHGSLMDYLFLGAKHMITGYDHILFLIGVIFFLKNYLDIIKFVSVFTIGHSITLIFATLFEVSANYYLIDAVIAFSVIYKGFENLDGFKKYLDKNPPNLILMVFIFGLIHGFGLSTRLQQLDLNQHNLILSILSFNVGVELGQILALVIVFIISSIIHKSTFDKISKVLNWGLICLGTLLFIYQINGYFNHHEHIPQDKVKKPHTHNNDNKNQDHHH